eukprot:jgi/Chrpa1/17760/Chrysochromulina_OHIO_Genome00021920-RA
MDRLSGAAIAMLALVLAVAFVLPPPSVVGVVSEEEPASMLRRARKVLASWAEVVPVDTFVASSGTEARRWRLGSGSGVGDGSTSLLGNGLPSGSRFCARNERTRGAGFSALGFLFCAAPLTRVTTFDAMGFSMPSDRRTS